MGVVAEWGSACVGELWCSEFVQSDVKLEVKTLLFNSPLPCVSPVCMCRCLFVCVCVWAPIHLCLWLKTIEAYQERFMFIMQIKWTVMWTKSELKNLKRVLSLFGVFTYSIGSKCWLIDLSSFKVLKICENTLTDPTEHRTQHTQLLEIITPCIRLKAPTHTHCLLLLVATHVMECMWYVWLAMIQSFTRTHTLTEESWDEDEHGVISVYKFRRAVVINQHFLHLPHVYTIGPRARNLYKATVTNSNTTSLYFSMWTVCIAEQWLTFSWIAVQYL